MRQLGIFDDGRLTMGDALDLTAQSMMAYGTEYRHWAVAYSGGKDSSATVTVLAQLIAEGRIPQPDRLTVLYADTRMELPPLQIAAFGVMEELERRGINTRVVLPEMDDRFFVYMFGRGVPPPKNRFRWCTGQLKVEPMEAALQRVRDETGEKVLMITGVRLGESAIRDNRILSSCSRDGAECGQGWFQQTTSEAVADVLAPLVHWRVCHVWDWLTFDAPSYGFPTDTIAEAYGGDEAEETNARTGCVGCNLASRDVALDAVIRQPHWEYLTPFLRLKPLYRELKKAKYRLRKDGSDRRKDGSLVSNPMRMGPLTMAARRMGVRYVLDVQDDINAAAREQGRPTVSLINDEELARIRELMDRDQWPNGWEGTEPTGDVMLDEVIAEGVIQPLLAGALEEIA